ncbi:Oidioi.mRNA.OKI2018_I69.chr1.g1714.t1.cds [Oikopleura dioica]|uniref:phospholipase D n=1 Tax=Oikopleura dioica TaxID=34765 RepID=A0ABN7SNR9_OIKDI|nr:Oidioi.mRNA.OKI2018_I69.chr1.g1714.t1.cds [Oikopleura dioica]
MIEIENSHGSFAPTRKGSRARWFICGEDYFVAVKEAIDSAKEEIFIAGWWFMPQIELIRTEQRVTLEKSLKEAVRRGVKIFILVFNSNLEYILRFTRFYTAVKRKNKIYRENLIEHIRAQVVDQSMALLGGIDLCIGRYGEHGKYSLFDSSEEKFKGADYFNSFENPDWEKPRKDLKRIPYHDNACQIFGESARDLAAHFIQRWNFSNEKINSFCCFRLNNTPALQLKCIEADYNIEERYGGHFDLATNVESIQVLRSAGESSTGLKEKECSIYNAYCEVIKHSKRFIYIETQWFISDASLSQNSSNRIQNKIAASIASRIITAFEKDEDFKVYIVLPEVADFYGKFEDRNTPEQELFFHLQRHSLTEGVHSIKHQLDLYNSKMSSENPEKQIVFDNYITIAAFHKWEKHNNELFHSQIYVHSKLMIVDDERCIIGSANIQDRCFLGDRDTETSVLINGKEFCKSFRLKIWSVALGSLNGLDLCPSKDEFFFDHWNKVANANSSALWEAFRNLPHDSIKEYLNDKDPSWQKWKEEYEHKQKLPTEQKLEALKDYQGFLVKYQINFASNNKEIKTSSTSTDLIHKFTEMFL